MFWPYSSKINQIEGLLLLFSHRDVQKIGNEKFFLHLEIAQIDRGVNFGSIGTILDIKTQFFELTHFLVVDIRICWLIPLRKGYFLTSYPKTRKDTTLKFFLRNGLVAMMTHAKFHFNRIMVKLLFDMRNWQPAHGPGERLKRQGIIGLLSQHFLPRQGFCVVKNYLLIGSNHILLCLVNSWQITQEMLCLLNNM